MPEAARGLVVAAVDFKNFWFYIWLRPGRIVWPAGCSCCLASVPEHKTIALKGKSFIYPICSSCQRHSWIDEVALGISAVIGIILPVAAYTSLFGLSYLRGGMYMLWLFYLIAVALVAGAVYWVLSIFVPGKTAACADSSYPAEEEESELESDPLDPNTERTDERELRMFAKKLLETEGSGFAILRLTNGQFARQLISANGGDPAQMVSIKSAI